MAVICPYPGRKCIGCEHRRIDEDLGSYVCYVKSDLMAATPPDGKTETLNFEKDKTIDLAQNCFGSEEFWEQVCDIIGVNPRETKEVKLYFKKAQVKK